MFKNWCQLLKKIKSDNLVRSQEENYETMEINLTITPYRYISFDTTKYHESVCNSIPLSQLNCTSIILVFTSLDTTFLIIGLT